MGLGLTRPGLADEVPLTSDGSLEANYCDASRRSGGFPWTRGTLALLVRLVLLCGFGSGFWFCGFGFSKERYGLCAFSCDDG